jgi:glycosyltransferase involved in cell wall biosynthesis
MSARRSRQAVGEPPDDRVELSVVVPVYRCAGCLVELHGRLVRVIESIGVSFEIVFVDDRSPDSSWERIVSLVSRDPRVRAIRLSRNFGQHAAITAGLAESLGRWILVMDCDLQDPPEELPRLYREALSGYDIVFARRKGRRHTLFRRAAARIYTGLMNRFLGSRIEGEYGAYSIVSRPVRDAYLSIGDRGRHYLLILYWLGFRHTAIDVEHAPRHAGPSSYTFGRLIQHAVDGVFFQTTVLLRWIVYLGFAVALFGALVAVGLVFVFFAGDPPPGWTSLAVLILVVGGFIIISTGVTGLYIGKIFDQVRDRPLYVVDRRVGGLSEDSEDHLAAQATEHTSHRREPR